MRASIQEKNMMLNIFDNANVVAIYLNHLGNVLFYNKKLKELTAKDDNQLLGKHWFSILCPEPTAEMKQHMFKAIVDDTFTYRRANIFEGMLTDSNGSERIISWNITPMLKGDGTISGILILGSDITTLKEREASAQNIDATLKNIFSSIKEYALYASNLEGNITYYGMGAELMFGWQRNEIIFKHISVLHAYADVNIMLPFILEKVNQQEQYELETFLIKKDGSSFPVILSVSKLVSSGSFLGYIFMAKDITERKKLEYQIFQSEKVAAVGQLAAGMAHEINNPLFVISGNIELLLDSKKLNIKIKKGLKSIESQVHKIRLLVDRVLVFTRKSAPRAENLDINKVIKKVLPFLNYHKLPTLRKIKIKKELSKELGMIKGDLNQLQEVLLNLFINACQAMKDGGLLTIKTENINNEFAQITISDTGHGISPDNLKNMFLPFFSTKIHGTGLGLSICYSIIKNHNGNIFVQSQVDKGTTFTIKLPFIKKGGTNELQGINS